MAQRNRWISLAAAAALAFGSASASSVALAHAAASEGASSEGSAEDQAPAYEPVDSFVIFTRPYSWNPVDDHTVVIWTTAFTAYLVELAFPSNDMKFVQAIGVTSSGSRVYAKFDAVQIRGFRYPIKNIYKLSRAEAKNLTRSEKPKNS
ncbi:MAG TPA: DUF6491 family protein [Gammaproteobacteria bacterium]|nr:DUF6491 family protein [Gammaproteobacteria bacterium]